MTGSEAGGGRLINVGADIVAKCAKPIRRSSKQFSESNAEVGTVLTRGCKKCGACPCLGWPDRRPSVVQRARIDLTIACGQMCYNRFVQVERVRL